MMMIGCLDLELGPRHDLLPSRVWVSRMANVNVFGDWHQHLYVCNSVGFVVFVGSAGDTRVAGRIGWWRLWLWWLHQQGYPVPGCTPWKCWYPIQLCL